MFAIMKREIKAYFCSPVAYVLIGVFMFSAGLLFTSVNLFSGDGNILSIFGTLDLIFMLIVPILTMRIMSDDRKNGTEVLLLTSPTSTTEIVMGKFLAAYAVFLIMVALSFIFPIIIAIYGTPALAPIIGGYIGFILLGGAFIAIGVFASSLSENQVVSALLSFVILLFVFLVDGVATTLGGIVGEVLLWFSLLSRFQPFYMGLLDIAPIVYFISFIAVFLFLTIRLMDRRRWTQS